MATTTVNEPIPAEILEDIRDAITQADQRANQAIQYRGRAAHLDGEAAGFRAAAERICERKLKAGKEDTIDIVAGTITRVVEVPDPPPPPDPPASNQADPNCRPADWFEPPANTSDEVNP
jgi:hypothetical protein